MSTQLDLDRELSVIHPIPRLPPVREPQKMERGFAQSKCCSYSGLDVLLAEPGAMKVASCDGLQRV